MSIGSLGDFVFEVSADFVRTLKDLKIDGSVSFAEHNVIGGKQLLEFTGSNVATVTFNIQFLAMFGLVPTEEVKRLREIRDNGEAVYFIVDGEPQGKDRWVVTQIAESWDHLDKGGSPHLLDASLTLKEYVEVT